MAGVALLLLGCSRAPEPGVQTTSARGLDLQSRDSSVRPGDDFYAYAGGEWLKHARIPPDLTRWGTLDALEADAQTHVRDLIESIPPDASGPHRQVADYYHAYLDTATIDKRGLAPAQAGLAAIEAVQSLPDIVTLVGRPDFPINWPVFVSIDIDQKNPNRYIVAVQQGGLSLPDRDYYLKPDTALMQTRARFVAHVERLMRLAGDSDAQSEARQILAVETGIAQIQWPAAQQRDVEATYNLRSRSQLQALDPAYPWAAFLKSAGLDGEDRFAVRELDAVVKLEKLSLDTPLSVWKLYLKYHYLNGMADVLPQSFDAERFSFYGKDLNGQQQQRERWKRAVSSIDSVLGEAAGELYVSGEFPPESKAKVQRMVEDLRAAYTQRIRSLSWMSESTKTTALEKLRALRPKIGYPDAWRDYSSVEIRSDDAFGNAIRAWAFDWNRRVARMSGPTDRDEWQMTPQTVNAYYETTLNEIVFPAALLQPPFFDRQADDAVNYGAIGAVIGHEMGHVFDDQGSKTDENGILRTWWTPGDEAAFRKRTDRLAAQYDRYEPLPGFKINGRLTLGENIGDLGGLQTAREAYGISRHGAEAPVLEGLSGDQRFFLSWGQAWRQVIRPERLRNQLLSDTHSPANFRVNGVVRNIDAWYAAFNVVPGDRLYLAPEDRVHLW